MKREAHMRVNEVINIEIKKVNHNCYIVDEKIVDYLQLIF